MQIIEAALAFAVTMLVLSIVCSALVETIHRTFGMREAGYRKMLGELFDYVLTTYAQSESKEQFQARMSSFRCPLGVASSVKEPPKFTSPRDKAYESVATLWRGRGLSGQTTAAFMEKLGTSPIGKDLVSKVEDAAGTKMGNAEDEMKKAVDRTLQDVAQKFEAFGERQAPSFNVAHAYCQSSLQSSSPSYCTSMPSIFSARCCAIPIPVLPSSRPRIMRSNGRSEPRPKSPNSKARLQPRRTSRLRRRT